MSEYQYYEFLALDRALTQHDIRELCKYSTRATITATRFVNHYEWGDFKGNPSTWVQKYFDAFLYFANWGTHRLMQAPAFPGARHQDREAVFARSLCCSACKG